MTEKAYYVYASPAPYAAEIRELSAGTGGAIKVILDKTIFYPEGGGQSGDRGTINGVPLLDVLEEDGEIIHLFSAEHAEKLKPGPATLVLDSRRRHDFTQLHTGQHLLSGIILRKLGAPTVSLHLGEDICTIDVDIQTELNEELLIEIEEAVADAIEENHPVITHLCPPEDISSFSLRKVPPIGEEVIRVVEVEGFDTIACCGTHLKSTAEIGMLRVLNAEKYKGKARIAFLAGRRVLRDSRLLYGNAGIVSKILSVPVRDTGKAVLDFADKAAQTGKRLKFLEEENVCFKAEFLLRKAALHDGMPPKLIGIKDPQEEVLPRLPVIIERYTNEGIDEVLGIGRAAQKHTGAVLILASVTDLKIAALCSDKTIDLRPFIKEALEAHGGRGGGGPSFYQGSFGNVEAMEAFLGSIGYTPESV